MKDKKKRRDNEPSRLDKREMRKKSGLTHKKKRRRRREGEKKMKKRNIINACCDEMGVVGQAVSSSKAPRHLPRIRTAAFPRSYDVL